MKAEAGLIQAESVKELDRLRFEFGTVITSSMPSKYKAFPILPLAHTAPLVKIPVFPFPEASPVLVPVPSSNFQ